MTPQRSPGRLAFHPDTALDFQRIRTECGEDAYRRLVGGLRNSAATGTPIGEAIGFDWDLAGLRIGWQHSNDQRVPSVGVLIAVHSSADRTDVYNVIAVRPVVDRRGEDELYEAGIIRTRVENGWARACTPGMSADLRAVNEMGERVATRVQDVMDDIAANPARAGGTPLVTDDGVVLRDTFRMTFDSGKRTEVQVKAPKPFTVRKPITPSEAVPLEVVWTLLDRPEGADFDVVEFNKIGPPAAETLLDAVTRINSLAQSSEQSAEREQELSRAGSARRKSTSGASPQGSASDAAADAAHAPSRRQGQRSSESTRRL